MIDEYYTFLIFGYYSDDLKPQSNKRIVVICDECKKYRDMLKENYTNNKYPDLCSSCSHKKRFKDPKEREKLSIPQKKRYEDSEEHKKTSTAVKKRHKEDPTIRKRMSKSGKKRWEDPEEHKKASVALKKRYKEDPTIRKRMSIAHIKRFEEDPTIRKRMSENNSGEKNNNWQGGISFGEYCPKFNEKLKQQIRDQYNNCDFMSGLPASICNVLNNKVYKLDVHHVDYNKQQGCKDHEWRLIPLSKKNHTKTNANRLFWNLLFTYALQYDGTYYEDELSFK